MHDTFLLNKISHALKQICNENKIGKIEEFTLVVSDGSHVSEENLLEYLKLHNSEIISKELKIKIQRDDIETQTAIIIKIQGETIGV